MSFILEFMNGYSLQDLIDTVGSLNEEMLRNIANQILEGFEEYNDNYLSDYGELCPCEIMFTKEGQVKVNYQTLTLILKIIDNSESLNQNQKGGPIHR